MDFFEYAQIADTIGELYTGRSNMLVSFLVGGLCFAVVYIFQAVGLFIIAGREGYKYRWMAFVPFLNTYYISVCGQKNKFFGFNTKIVGIIAAATEALLFSLYIVEYVAVYNLELFNCFDVTEITDTYTGIVRYSRTVAVDSLPASLNWAAWCYNYLDYFTMVLDLGYLFTLVIVLSCFFQTYATRRYLLFTITSVLFPIQGVLIFAVKNNKSVCYAEYVRRMQEMAYRQYRDQQNFYQNPYDGNPYNRRPPEPPYGDPTTPPPTDSGDPFSEYPDDNGNTPNSNSSGGSGGSSDSGDPFDEFKN